MAKFEKQLNQLIKQISDDVNFINVPIAGITNKDLRFLSAKGLVKLHWLGGYIMSVSVTAKGLTYFSDKRSRFFTAAISFVLGIASTLIAQVLWQSLQLLLQ